VTRTDALKDQICAELEARRAQIDDDQPLDSVSLIVRLTSAGQVLDIAFRTEGRRAVGKRRHAA
jgi:hypothetical protein